MDSEDYMGNLNVKKTFINYMEGVLQEFIHNKQII